jgi:hypothetical protein
VYNEILKLERYQEERFIGEIFSAMNTFHELAAAEAGPDSTGGEEF